MTRGELILEVKDRGYSHVSGERIGRWIDDAYRVLCSRYPWPFLEATKTGTSPLEIDDLRKVLSVTDSTGDAELSGADRRWIAATFPDLPDTGSPTYWYLENKTLLTYPADTSELSIRYIKQPAAMEEADEPLIPSEWQYLMVDRAVAKCLRRADEYEEARALEGDVEAGLREMVHAELGNDLQGPRLMIRTGPPGSYL